MFSRRAESQISKSDEWHRWRPVLRLGGSGSRRARACRWGVVPWPRCGKGLGLQATPVAGDSIVVRSKRIWIGSPTQELGHPRQTSRRIGRRGLLRSILDDPLNGLFSSYSVITTLRRPHSRGELAILHARQHVDIGIRRSHGFEPLHRTAPGAHLSLKSVILHA